MTANGEARRAHQMQGAHGSRWCSHAHVCTKEVRIMTTSLPRTVPIPLYYNKPPPPRRTVPIPLYYQPPPRPPHRIVPIPCYYNTPPPPRKKKHIYILYIYIYNMHNMHKYIYIYMDIHIYVHITYILLEGMAQRMLAGCSGSLGPFSGHIFLCFVTPL